VARLLMMTEPVDGDPTLGRQSAGTAVNDPSMPFAIEGLVSGRYLLRNFNELAGVAAMWNVRDLRDSGFDASLGQDFDDVVVTLTDKLAQLSGAVSGRAGTVSAVIVFPVDRKRLPAGEYFVVAVDPLQINLWTDPSFLAAAAAQATRVTLEWGDKKTQDVPYREVVVK
jgi:hypothetical protein